MYGKLWTIQVFYLLFDSCFYVFEQCFLMIYRCFVGNDGAFVSKCKFGLLIVDAPTEKLLQFFR